MKVKATLVKAFTKDKNGGNPAGVVENAQVLTEKQMIHIANDLGFSETAFILPPLDPSADHRIRFFTPLTEVNYCGHATIAAYHLISQTNKAGSFVQETLAGLFNITVDDTNLINMEQKIATFGEKIESLETIAGILNVDSAGISDIRPIQVVSTNVPKVIVPMMSKVDLDKIKPNFERMKSFDIKYGFYCYASDSEVGSRSIYTRSFNPLVGINEDAATGVAAGPLGAYIKKYDGGTSQVVVNQGYAMGSKSALHVTLASNSVTVGGNAVIFGEKEYVFDE